MELFNNPFRPGAGQPPPFLAGREGEIEEFEKLLDQNPILKNVIITGLRGVGKTVLLEKLKPIAIEKGWFWTGTDLSESAGLSEQNLSIRILADISALVSSFTIKDEDRRKIGFALSSEVNDVNVNLSYEILFNIYRATPGLEADKLKRVLETVWDVVKTKVKGIILAYDEAQILKDKAVDKEYPLSLLLEVIQFMQKKEIPYLLVLTGLPTLYPNLIEARTYAERMFQVMTLDKLPKDKCKEAILEPINKEGCPVRIAADGVEQIINLSDGYPYFIQFLCKEVYDIILQQIKVGNEDPIVFASEIIKKLDADFYSGRFSRVTDRQRDLLSIIAQLPNAKEEFTSKEINAKSKELNNLFSPAYINSLLLKYIDFGLVYKNKHGKYSFAVPLLSDYINRTQKNNID
jgi:hypothetical protein